MGSWTIAIWHKNAVTSASLARQALEWVEEPKNDPRIAQDRLFLERALRSQAYQAGRLAQSVERPMWREFWPQPGWQILSCFCPGTQRRHADCNIR